MKNTTVLIVFLFSLLVYASCSKNDDINAADADGVITYDKGPSIIDNTNTGNQSDCTFVQRDEDMDGFIDDNERAIMNECFQNAFTTKAEIKNNLIGKWNLIGHGEGWFPIYSQPCASLVIDENTINLKFENTFIDTTYLLNWELEEVNWVGQNYWTLVTTPDISPWLYINTFSSNMMYGDATPADGNMYLYEKIE